MKKLAIFAAFVTGTTMGGAWLLSHAAQGPDAVRAIWISAFIALGVQTVGFSFAWMLRKDHMMAGWGAGLALRFLALVFHAFLGVKALGLPPTPALLSLAGFFFVTTLVEPVLLS